MTLTATMFVERDGRDLEVELSCEYEPAGFIDDPDDVASFDDLRARVNGEDIDLTPREEDEAWERLEDSVSE